MRRVEDWREEVGYFCITFLMGLEAELEDVSFFDDEDFSSLDRWVGIVSVSGWKISR